MGNINTNHNNNSRHNNQNSNSRSNTAGTGQKTKNRVNFVTTPSTKPKPKLKMDESAHTFGANNNTTSTNQQNHTNNTSNSHRRGSNTSNYLMITDALSDVRVNYHIDMKELGHGHYGVVRKCYHRQTGECYAVKSIKKSKVSKIEVLKREIEILKEVKHPHIIELIEVYEDERYLHLVTELCSGGELFDRIIAKTQSDEGHFSEHDAAVLVRDILDAIKYCHEKGIVHRDLKPENFLFLTEADDAPVKIIDFGLSRHDDTDLGVMVTKVGTPYYVAPEVLKREYTNSCDIWSIGVITYILLCGYPPFYGDSDTQIFESVRVGKFDFPSPEWDDISTAAKEFVIELLMKDPMKRPSAAKALQNKWLREQLGGDEFENGSNGMARRASISHRSIRTSMYTNYLAVKKLKKAALGIIVTNLTQEEVGTLADIFHSMDQNSDGKISLVELDEAIEKGNFSENLQLLNDLRTLRTDLAISGDHQFDWRDFVSSTMDRSLALREDNIRYAFEHLQQQRQSEENKEYLTIDDLATIFGGQAQAREVMAAVLDADNDGKVSYEDFSNALCEIILTSNDDETSTGCGEDESSNAETIS